jgi:hypothetical protein
VSGEEPGVLITVRDIYTKVIELSGKVDLMLSARATSDDKVADHEARLRTLERARWPLPAVTILIALASLGVAAAALLTR